MQAATTQNTTAAAPLSAPLAESQNSARDFDFFIGEWTLENRRLRQRLTGCQEWETFAATQHVQKLPGGIGNFDDFVAESWRPGFVGMSLRIFNPQTNLWSIYWLNNHDGGLDQQSGQLLPPVVGRFENGIGIFECHDQLDGKPIIVRYTWSEIKADSARWEQAFSADEGQSWETNWIMCMTRSSPPLPASTLAAPAR